MNDAELKREGMILKALVLAASKLAYASHDEASGMLLGDCFASMQFDAIDLENDGPLVAFCRTLFSVSESPGSQPFGFPGIWDRHPEFSNCFSWILRAQSAIARKALMSVRVEPPSSFPFEWLTAL